MTLAFRQSRPDYGLGFEDYGHGFQVEVLKTFYGVPSLLGSGDAEAGGGLKQLPP